MGSGDVAVEPIPVRAAPRCRLAESPRWVNGQWWWLDAVDGRVWTSTSLDRPPTLVLAAGRRVSAVLPVGPDAAVIADGKVLRTLYRSGNRWHTGSPLSLGLDDGWILNDGCVDTMGRVWIGAIAPDRSPGSGRLIWTDGTRVETAHDGITCSNGMAWSTDGQTLYHADTGERVVLAHRIDPVRGVITDTRVGWAVDDGLPDGVAVDTQGAVWVARYGTGTIQRFGAAADSLIVRIPTPQVTSLCFGGADGRDLLITTAREGFDEDASRKDPLAGTLFRARAPVPGLALAGAVPGLANRLSAPSSLRRPGA